MISAIAIRLQPQQDLKLELDRLTQTQQFEAACIITCVGSLTKAVLRHADQPHDTKHEGPFEIVSLTGIMSTHGSHYHMAIADTNGRTIGGHVLEGCLIHTTAELVIGLLPQLSFRREFDRSTGYKELAIAELDSIE